MTGYSLAGVRNLQAHPSSRPVSHLRSGEGSLALAPIILPGLFEASCLLSSNVLMKLALLLRYGEDYKGWL